MYSISVIVPVFNGEKYLGECLTSLENQSIFGAIKFILVDDGSTDGTAALLKAFAAKHGNVFVLSGAHGGVSSARNLGMSIAQGEYIGFVDADDFVAPDYFEKLYSCAKKSGADFVFGGYTLLMSSGERRRFMPQLEQNRLLSCRELAEYASDNSELYSVWTKLFKLDIIKKYGVSFNEKIGIAEDKRFLLEFLLACENGCCSDGAGYFHRDNPQGAMQTADALAVLAENYGDELLLFCRLGLSETEAARSSANRCFEELADFLQRNRKNLKPFFERSKRNQQLESIIRKAEPSGTVHRLLHCFYCRNSLIGVKGALLLQKIVNGRRI